MRSRLSSSVYRFTHRLFGSGRLPASMPMSRLTGIFSTRRTRAATSSPSPPGTRSLAERLADYTTWPEPPQPSRPAGHGSSGSAAGRGTTTGPPPRESAVQADDQLIAQLRAAREGLTPEQDHMFRLAYIYGRDVWDWRNIAEMEWNW